mgnify:FL=1
MFRGQGLAKPQTKSLVGALVAAILVASGSQASPMLGYALALLAMLMIIVALHMESIWPTQSRKENTLVFSVFWGLMLGGILPFVVGVFLEGGLSAVYELFTS